ncbi:MAG: threonine synthase [Armatimonadetes bacterium]|nr:threonine synthase [Armatimonadota bacterium]
MNDYYLKCLKCHKKYIKDQILYTCFKCGGLLDVYYNYEKISKEIKIKKLTDKDFDLKTFSFLLPIKEELLPPLKVGGTPLYEVIYLRELLGLKNLYIKDDGLNPTASFKDRASAIAIAKARELKQNIIACASTGNAASSLAGLSASSKISSIIFVPQNAPPAKLTQSLIYGAKVFNVKGNYDQAYDICLEASKKYGWYNRNTGFNPYLLEGKKTAGLEILLQLKFNVPDKIIVSVGDGCILASIYKGFLDAKYLNWISQIPQIIGVQAKGADPLKRAFDRKTEVRPIIPNTVADSISVGHPRAAAQALRALIKSKGFMLNVSDQEILKAQKILAAFSGIFAEPAASAAAAGLIKLAKNKQITSEEKIVVLITGSGLKDLNSAQKLLPKAYYIKPNLKDLSKIIEKDFYF